MLIYNYNPITKEYIGSSETSLDPEETKKQHKDVYLIPANATTVKPPKAKTHEVIIYENGWQRIADYRGEYIVNSDMQPYIYDKTGDLPDRYVYITHEQAKTIQQDDLYYVIEGNELVINPDYEEQKQARESERVSHLTCTKRVFVLMLEELGIDYFEQVQPKIEANRQAKLEWELCVELERVNPLLDLIGAELGITPEQIDKLFKYANGEITAEEFIPSSAQRGED